LGLGQEFPDPCDCALDGKARLLRVDLQPMVDIVENVLTSGAHAHLAGLSSMTDLIVAARPVSEPPVEVVIVRLQWGTVTIEHVSHNGRNDKISRPASDAVRLFWRFMIEKFGVHPTQTGAPDR
jgi:hypothetical protein